MEQILQNMQETTDKFAEILAEILKVDVNIVDGELRRVSGTGRLKDKTANNLALKGFLHRRALETGLIQVAEYPGEAGVCLECPIRGECNEIYEMCTPIVLNGKGIGVIGFICYTQKQRKHIIRNQETFTRFLVSISEMIAAKAVETMEAKKNRALALLLEDVLNQLKIGVAVIDEGGSVSTMNRTGRRLLGLSEEECRHIPVELNFTGGNYMDMQEYELKIKGKHFLLAGNLYDVYVDQYHKIFLFEDAHLMKETAFHFLSGRKNSGVNKIIGNSPAIKGVKEMVRVVACSQSTVLITGESGTGKELFATALHEESNRSTQPFIPINCGAIPEGLLESELFGYTGGAFTGADPKGKMGKFEAAHGGTLFLDEIGDMPYTLQVKLLRVLEKKEIVRIGSNKPVPVDIRLVAATNSNLAQLVQEKKFRGDLFYRLNVIPIHIPPLREREGDKRLLCMHFIQLYKSLFLKTVSNVEGDFWAYIESYHWPGNVRELQNTIEYVLNMLQEDGIIHIGLLGLAQQKERSQDFNLAELERKTILKVLEIYGDSPESKRIAAEKLGIGVATLYRKIKKYCIEVPDGPDKEKA